MGFFPLREMSNKKPCSSSHHLQTWQFPSRHGIWEVPIKYHMSASLGSCRSAVFWYRPMVIFLKGHKIAKYPRKSSFCFFSDRKMNATQMLPEFWTKEKKRRGREWMTFWIWRRALLLLLKSIVDGNQSSWIHFNDAWWRLYLDGV